MYGGVEVYLRVFLISVLDGGYWSASRLGRFIPVEMSTVSNELGPELNSASN
jgi:hypothetical protein